MPISITHASGTDFLVLKCRDQIGYSDCLSAVDEAVSYLATPVSGAIIDLLAVEEVDLNISDMKALARYVRDKGSFQVTRRAFVTDRPEWYGLAVLEVQAERLLGNDKCVVKAFDTLDKAVAWLQDGSGSAPQRSSDSGDVV